MEKQRRSASEIRKVAALAVIENRIDSSGSMKMCRLVAQLSTCPSDRHDSFLPVFCEVGFREY